MLSGLNSLLSDDEEGQLHGHQHGHQHEVQNVMDVLVKDGKARQQRASGGYTSLDDSMNNSVSSATTSRRGGGGGGDAVTMMAGTGYRRNSSHSQLSSVKENIVSAEGDCGEVLGCSSADSVADTGIGLSSSSSSSSTISSSSSSSSPQSSSSSPPSLSSSSSSCRLVDFTPLHPPHYHLLLRLVVL